LDGIYIKIGLKFPQDPKSYCLVTLKALKTYLYALDPHDEPSNIARVLEKTERMATTVPRSGLDTRKMQIKKGKVESTMQML
jgi:hypothetical protein